MADKNAEQIKSLYAELAKVAPTQEWASILKVAKKILGISINEKTAFHCKIVCLIQLEKFDEALTSIERFNAELNDFYFERAYCEYRLDMNEKALKTLKSCPSMGLKEKELLAQVNYKLEKFEESYDTYRDIIKSTEDDYGVERQTNLSAVASAVNNSPNKTSTKDLDMSDYESRTYELCYNTACLLLSQGNFGQAEEKLKKAEDMCRSTFEGEEDLTEADLENEIAIIRVQLAYCLQKLGRHEEANKIYNSVLKNKPDDIAVVAVASNNAVTLNKDQNVFDSKKKIKTATGSDVDLKLHSYQRSTIAYNEALLALTTNQNDLTNKLLKQFETKFDDKLSLISLKVSQLFKEKRFKEVEDYLRENIASVSAPLQNKLKFYLLQAVLQQGKLDDAVEVFKSIEQYLNYPGLVSALVCLYNNLNKQKEASNLLDSTIANLKKSNADPKQLEIYLKKNVDYQMKCNNVEKAVEILESLRKLKPKDHKILSQLINTYSKFDQNKAKALSSELPSLSDLVSNEKMDIDALESQFSLKYGRTKAKEAKGDASTPNSPVAKKDEGTKSELKKKNKKKKVKLPKNYVAGAHIDPERWVPLRERSYYKGRRRKKNVGVGKGTQGAVGESQTTQSPVSSPMPEKPAVKVPPKAAQAKKKKKGGSKW